ncbi:hypothetical protein [Cellulomonas shaoxiangyii]|uniref:PH domain-containing protein n=1 Tax=Cellulomonas shaoxiangyii TaxID=2566013 RepID=A0A4P7SJL0_9CELL|nr:hypothetical protein [Cellulomonas shaoxiangyii]QCB92703.1 hypothetical protein E5225_03185 [Cellulomonas shaoxiangyii]TGY85828.1 hypothetical protein E5226_04630 [Cellulomonas shaoxiangyii]
MTELSLLPDARRRVVRTNVVAVAVYMVFLVAITGTSAVVTGHTWLAVAGVAAGLTLVAATAASAVRAADRSRLAFGDGTYTVLGSGRPRRFTAAQVSTAALVTHMSLGAGATHHLIVAGPTKPLVHLVGQMWDHAQLTAMAQDLAANGVPITSVTEPITPRALRTRDARLMAGWRARPRLTALAAVAVAVVLVAVVVTVVAVLMAVTTGA